MPEWESNRGPSDEESVVLSPEVIGIWFRSVTVYLFHDFRQVGNFEVYIYIYMGRCGKNPGLGGELVRLHIHNTFLLSNITNGKQFYHTSDVNVKNRQEKYRSTFEPSIR